MFLVVKKPSNKEESVYRVLFSFISPSCIIACNREIVNINSFFYKSAMSHSLEVNVISKDINMDKPVMIDTLRMQHGDRLRV